MRMTGKQQQMLHGHILGLERLGCKFIKEDNEYLYFRIPTDLNQDVLKDISTTLYEYTGMKLKVAKIV